MDEIAERVARRFMQAHPETMGEPLPDAAYNKAKVVFPRAEAVQKSVFNSLKSDPRRLAKGLWRYNNISDISVRGAYVTFRCTTAVAEDIARHGFEVRWFGPERDHYVVKGNRIGVRFLEDDTNG
jgi:hypothetical protein